MGPITSQTLRELGWEPAIEAKCRTFRGCWRRRPDIQESPRELMPLLAAGADFGGKNVKSVPQGLKARFAFHANYAGDKCPGPTAKTSFSSGL